MISLIFAEHSVIYVHPPSATGWHVLMDLAPLVLRPPLSGSLPLSIFLLWYSKLHIRRVSMAYKVGRCLLPYLQIW
jgi:hypothetical protein